MDDLPQQQSVAPEEKAIEQVACALVSMARELIRREDMGEEKIDELLHYLKDTEYD